jgi:hypothetical protein
MRVSLKSAEENHTISSDGLKVFQEIEMVQYFLLISPCEEWFLRCRLIEIFVMIIVLTVHRS